MDEIVSQAAAQGVSPTDFMPDTIAYHAYTGQYSPEGEKVGSVIHEFPKTLQTLYDKCEGSNLYPAFAITEYGYSPTGESQGLENPWAADNSAVSDSYKQGHYYTRSRLIHGTMMAKNGINGIPQSTLKNIYYFHHCKDPYPVVQNNVLYDFGFHNFDILEATMGSPRAIKDNSTKLSDQFYGFRFNQSEYQIWIPIELVAKDSSLINIMHIVDGKPTKVNIGLQCGLMDMMKTTSVGRLIMLLFRFRVIS